MKKKIRKQILKKYAVTTLLAALNLLYLYATNWTFGLGLKNIGYQFTFLFFSGAEKFLGILLFVCLFLPDLVHLITGSQPSRRAER